MGYGDRTAFGGAWNTLAPTHEGVDDLQGDGEHRAIQSLLGHSKIENTVRYLRVDVEDAILLAE